MKWAMLGHIHLDRTAVTWLIRRFVDPDAEFEFVDWGRDGSPPTRALLDVVKPGVIPVGIPGVELGFHDEHGLCFTKVLRKYDLRDPALWRLERIILAGVNDAHGVPHASDVSEEERLLGVALNRIGMAYGVAFSDPEHLERARSLYDAVYVQCRIQELAPAVRRRDGEGYVQQVERLRELLEDGRPTGDR